MSNNGSQASSSRRPLHLKPPEGINILPPSPIDPTNGSPFRDTPSRDNLAPSPLAADALSNSPSDDAGLLLSPSHPSRMASHEDQPGGSGSPLVRVPSPSSPHYRPKPTHHRRTSSSHQVRETVDGSQTTTEDGRLVNQYRIGKSLGQGAYAKVELGVDVTTGKEYAIKEFSKSRLSYHALQERQRQSARSRLRKANRKREANDSTKTTSPISGGPWAVPAEREDDPLGLIRREIAVMKKLDHPNLIHLYEAISVPDADALFLVLEYLPGGTLMEVKLGTKDTEPPFSRQQSREYFRQLCLGLEYLHHNEVVHRDIKPDNILLSADREIVKLCDFGVSEMFAGDDRIKHTGGSPAFLSPESFQKNTSEVHGKGVDIWALGVTLYCMLTGRLPFNVENPIDLFEAVKTQDPEVPSGWPKDQTDLVKRMLIKDPMDRIRMREIRSHPWTTDAGSELMITKDDNLYYIGQQVEEPTQEELGSAIRPRRGIFTLIRAVQKMRRLGHIRRSLSGQTSGSSIPSSSMDSYVSNGSEGTSTDRTEPDMDGRVASPVDMGESEDDTPYDKQDTLSLRRTLRDSLRQLKSETAHHSSAPKPPSHHPESTHRHVHHVHHLKHHLRRSGNLIKGMDSMGAERAREMITNSRVSDDPETIADAIQAEVAEDLEMMDSPESEDMDPMEDIEKDEVDSPGEMSDEPEDSMGSATNTGNRWNRLVSRDETKSTTKAMEGLNVTSPPMTETPISTRGATKPEPSSEGGVVDEPEMVESPISEAEDPAQVFDSPVSEEENPLDRTT